MKLTGLWLLLALITATAACMHAEASTTHSVTILDLSFNPQCLCIEKSDTINWTNQDPVIHTLWFVFAENGSTYLLSDPIPPDTTWTYTFNDAVELQYYSFDRLWITGFITVQPGVHDVAVTNINAWPTAALRGDPIYINVTVENQGGFPETFNVTLYADRMAGDVHIEIENRTVSLDVGESRLLEFVWDTAGVPDGSYRITAEAILPGDAEPEDNIAHTYIGGIFAYEPPPINILALLLPTVLAVLIFIALGIAAVAFLKILASPKLLRLWRSQRHYRCKIH